MGISKQDIDRFASLISATPTGKGCWEWDGGKVDGYGVFRYGGKVWKAHRFSYLATVGNIEKGLKVLHQCDNPGCVNPDHLTQGTQADNVREMHERGRAARFLGEAHPMVKLRTDQVLKIKSLAARGLSTRSLGEKFKVSMSQVQRIVGGRAWRHVA